MNPRQHCLLCLQRTPAAPFEAALWIAAEHDPGVLPASGLNQLQHLQLDVAHHLPILPPRELAQPLLRALNTLGFQQEAYQPIRPQAALLDQVLQRRRGQPLALALLALEIARRLTIPLEGVNFPGHFLLRVPGADYLLDPCGGRRLYPSDCRELLQRRYGARASLSAEHLAAATPAQMLQRLSRNLRQLHTQHDDYLAALVDAERVMQLGPVFSTDYLARAALYQRLNCPQAERFDLEHALLLSEDPLQRLQLTERLEQLPVVPRSLH